LDAELTHTATLVLDATNDAARHRRGIPPTPA